MPTASPQNPTLCFQGLLVSPGLVSSTIGPFKAPCGSSLLLGFPGAQLVKNLPAVRETWVQFLGWEDLLEEGMATQSTILVRKIPIDRGAWQAIVHGIAESQTRLGSQAQRTLLLVTATLIGPTGLVWPQHWVLIGWAKT